MVVAARLAAVAIGGLGMMTQRFEDESSPPMKEIFTGAPPLPQLNHNHACYIPYNRDVVLSPGSASATPIRNNQSPPHHQCQDYHQKNPPLYQQHAKPSPSSDYCSMGNPQYHNRRIMPQVTRSFESDDLYFGDNKSHRNPELQTSLFPKHAPKQGMISVDHI